MNVAEVNYKRRTKNLLSKLISRLDFKLSNFKGDIESFKLICL